MSFKPNLGQQQPFFYSSNLNRNFLETEIQEIRNDDTSKAIVYGPAMSLAKPYESPIPALSGSVSSLGADLLPLFNRYKPTPLNFPLNAINLQPLQYVALQQLQTLPFFDGLKQNSKLKKPAIDAKKPSGSSNFESKTNSLQKNFHQAESTKQQNVQSLLNSCRIPASLSITLTNDESESVNRSTFNTKNSNVVNSIEIVKLTDELNNEPNARFPSPLPSSSTSSTVDKTWPPTTKTQQANKIDSTSPTPKDSQAEFQMNFMQSLKTVKKSQPSLHQKQIRPNLNVSIEEIARNQEAIKRKLQMDDKSVTKVRKLQLSTPQHKTSPTQRPVPDLLMPKDDKKISASNSSPAQSSSSAGAISNNKSATDRQSPTVSSNVSSSDKSTSLTLAVAQAKVQQVDIPTSKYLPIQTSSMPIWANHCTADQMASHKALVENLTQSKKNSGTFVD